MAEWSIAYEVGSGMTGFFNQHVGLRDDVRYLRALEDANRRSGIDFDPSRPATATGGQLQA